MKPRGRHSLRAGLCAIVMAGSIPWLVETQGGSVAIDADDIGGTVTSANGLEAGVWVIAETTDLPTRFIRIVVTDDRGRYVIPDLPRETYQVFVRGYGLVDSARVTAKPGQQLNLKATRAPDAKAAAQIYPAAWWLAMVKAPAGAEAQKKLQMDLKECFDCHQLGNKATREILPSMSAGTASTLAASPCTKDLPLSGGSAKIASALGVAGGVRSITMPRLAVPKLPIES